LERSKLPCATVWVSEVSPSLLDIRHQAPLAPRTTLELGGPAAHFVTVRGDEDLREALGWARREGLPVALLGGGSNLVVADEGFPGLVLHLAQRGVRFRQLGKKVLVSARAGESWDEFVATTVDEGLAGVECLSGIPGSTGATPIQNVGAYGQEVAETVVAVRALDLTSLRERTFSSEQCAFAYRSSFWRRQPGRFAVLEVTFALTAGGAPTLRYPELVKKVGRSHARVPLTEVREAVLALRRSKSMLLDSGDPNRRSAGSFFVNPVVSSKTAAAVVARALELGVAASPEEVPRHPAPRGVKLSAGWLIEASGFPKGTRRGAVGLSSRHALALVHHGGGTAGELLAFAREIRDGVAGRFGITLQPEPVFLGFGSTEPL